MRQLPKVATAGLVAAPSKFNELVREQHYVQQLARGHRGSLHHHWIFTVQGKELLAIPKLPYLEHDETFMDLESLGMEETRRGGFNFDFSFSETQAPGFPDTFHD